MDYTMPTGPKANPSRLNSQKSQCSTNIRKKSPLAMIDRHQNTQCPTAYNTQDPAGKEPKATNPASKILTSQSDQAPMVCVEQTCPINRTTPGPKRSPVIVLVPHTTANPTCAPRGVDCASSPGETLNMGDLNIMPGATAGNGNRCSHAERNLGILKTKKAAAHSF